jgi:succinate dehydrogenase/fumarate reductase-like Fe-S protein
MEFITYACAMLYWPPANRVPLNQGLSVLGALDHIYENLEATLAYYDHAACAQGVCETCLAMTKGRVALTCQTLLTEDVVLELAGKSGVVRDPVTETKGGAR